MRITDIKLEHTNTSLKGFGGRQLTLLGIVELPVTIGMEPFEKVMILDFVVVEENNPYQMILGQPFMRASQCAVSTHYLALKYRVNEVVGVVKGDQRMARSCYATAAKENLQITALDNWEDSEKGQYELVETLEEVVMRHEDPSRTVKIRSNLS